MVIVAVERDVADLRHVGLNGDAQWAQRQLGQCTSYTAAYCDTGGGTATATMVAYAVFLEIGVVGVGGAKQPAHIVVVVGVLIGIAHDETDGRTRGAPLKDAAQQFHLVGFLALRGDAALAGSAT